MGSPMHKTAYWANMRQLHADTRKFLMILKRNVKLLIVFFIYKFHKNHQDKTIYNAPE